MNRIRSLVFFLLLLPFSVISQVYIDKNRSEVKMKLEQQISANNNLDIKLLESDTTLVYSIHDPKVQQADFIYQFDHDGKCNSEKVIASCDSCYQKFLQAALSRKEYGWIKINSNQYASKYSAKMMIDIPPENKQFSFRILRTNWSKKLYKILMKGL